MKEIKVIVKDNIVVATYKGDEDIESHYPDADEIFVVEKNLYNIKPGAECPVIDEADKKVSGQIEKEKLIALLEQLTAEDLANTIIKTK